MRGRSGRGDAVSAASLKHNINTRSRDQLGIRERRTTERSSMLAFAAVAAAAGMRQSASDPRSSCSRAPTSARRHPTSRHDMGSSDPGHVFQDLGSTADHADNQMNASEIESLCLNCRAEGTTRLLYTVLPFFKEVVVMSFECPHCGWKNNELQPAAEMQEQACRYTVKCSTAQDLNRQVVRTEWAEVRIPEIDFEISKQAGMVTTIEGLIDRAITGLQSSVARLSALSADRETVVKITEFIQSLHRIKSAEMPFTFILDDPTGNSFVEILLAPSADPCMQVTHYRRSRQQNQLIGLVADDDEEDNATAAGSRVNGHVSNGQRNESATTNGRSMGQEVDQDAASAAASPHQGTSDGDQIENPLHADPNELIKGESLEFVTNCNNCRAPCITRMKVTDIPHFKTIIIMATSCDACGEKTNEVKSGSGFEEKGVRITIHVTDSRKLTCDLVKSDSCGILIPELELELSTSGSGRYTTVEGLIENMKQQLRESNPFGTGDSASSESRARMDSLISKLDNKIGLTLILDDPSGNSWCADADSVEHYERSFEQKEELGINDMRVENYEDRKSSS